MFYEYNRIDSPDYFEVEEGINFSYPEHLHICFEIIIVTSGEMQITVDKKLFSLSKGDAMLIFPHQLHSLTSTNSEHILCIFSPNLIKTYYNTLFGQVPINNKFQPDDYLVNLLKTCVNNNNDNDNALRIKRKGLLYLLCAQFHEPHYCGFTSSWLSADDASNKARILKTTFIDPTSFNTDPQSFCIFGDESTINISKHIDNAYFTMLIKSSKAAKFSLTLSNFNGDQYFKTDTTISHPDVWQQINIPIKDMYHSKRSGEITYLILGNMSGKNAMGKNDYISLSKIKIISDSLDTPLWQISAKTPEHVPKYRIQQASDSALLHQIFAFVEKNFSNDCSLTTLSKITGYSYDYLSRYFKASSKISYNSYVNNFRLNHACYLLSNTNNKIIDCAFYSGYKSVRTFNRNFKEQYGITPEEYREKIKN